jgi:hypothetical protein
MHEGNNGDMNGESGVINSEQIRESSVQNFLNSHKVHGNSLGNFDTSGESHNGVHSWNNNLDAKPSGVLSTNQERNELISNTDSTERVTFSHEPSVTYNILSQKYDFIDRSFSLKNTPLYNMEHNIQIPYHMQRPHHRTSTKQKSKRFFPDVNKDRSVNYGMAIENSLSAKGITPHSHERNFLGEDILQDNAIRKALPSHKTYQDYDSPFIVNKNTQSFKTHHKLSENIDHKTFNKDTRNQSQSKESEDRNVYNDSGYQNNMNSIQFRHSYHLRQMEGRSFRSLLEPIEESEVENVFVHWPVKREAVVEGDLLLGGLMMVHEREDMYTCGPIMPQGGIQALETMLYTLDVLNKDKMIPNVTIGAHILDDCDKDTYGLEMAVDFIKGRTGWTGIVFFNTFRS